MKKLFLFVIRKLFLGLSVGMEASKADCVGIEPEQSLIPPAM